MKELYEEISKHNLNTFKKNQDILNNLNILFFGKFYFNGDKKERRLIAKSKLFLNKKTKNPYHNQQDEAKNEYGKEEANKYEKKNVLQNKSNLSDDFLRKLKISDKFSSAPKIQEKNTVLTEIPNNNEENSKIFFEIVSKSGSSQKKENIPNNQKINFKLSHKDYVRIKKNNKMVYINSDFALSENKNKINRIIFTKTTKRGSRFRGVSKNGNLWQVLIMHKKHNFYIGSFSSEEIAARIYDIKSYELKGKNAKTNFVYSDNELETIRKIDINSKDINDVISEIFINKKEC